jgi:hypothetical protein
MLKYETEVEFYYWNLPEAGRKPIPLLFFSTFTKPSLDYYENISVYITPCTCQMYPTVRLGGWLSNYRNSVYSVSNSDVKLTMIFPTDMQKENRSRWPRGLRRGSMAARLLGLRVRIPPRAWMSVSCEYCVLSGRGHCVGLITRPEESYRVWCVGVWSWSLDNEEALGHQGLSRHEQKKKNTETKLLNDFYRSHLGQLAGKDHGRECLQNNNINRKYFTRSIAGSLSIQYIVGLSSYCSALRAMKRSDSIHVA